MAKQARPSRVSGGMPPRKMLRKMVQICAIWCILAVFWEVIQRQEIYIMYNQSDLKTSCLWIFVVVIYFFFFGGEGGQGVHGMYTLKFTFPCSKKNTMYYSKEQTKYPTHQVCLIPNNHPHMRQKHVQTRAQNIFPAEQSQNFKYCKVLEEHRN